MTQNPRDFPQAAQAALKDERLKMALGRLKTHFAHGRADAVARYGDWEGLREQGRAIRDYAITHLDTLLEQFERAVVARGGHVHWALDAADARRIILGILNETGAKTVTKGKSMVSEEIALNPFLEQNGIAPAETDLGEYIVQLRKEPPSHIIAPAFHLNKEDVAETFREAHTTLDATRSLDERTSLVLEARAMLRAQFEAADAGITGANFLTAAEGTAILVTNEGNGDLTRLLPKTHIVLTGVEKVVADLDDAAVLLRLLTRSATGQDISSYVSIMSGPSRDGDGPENFHVVLLDNGRTNMIGTEAEDVLRCIRCAACLNHCPIYGAVGGHAYGAVYPGPIGAALNPGMLGVANAAHHANASTFCGRCAEVCPVKIPLTKIMRHWRAREYARGLAPKANMFGIAVWACATKRPWLYRSSTAMMARLLRMLGKRGHIRSLPLPHGWFAVRDFPAPQGKTFQELWRGRP